MSKLPLTFACGLYDRMLALHTGDVRPDGIDLNYIPMDDARQIFDLPVSVFDDDLFGHVVKLNNEVPP